MKVITDFNAHIGAKIAAARESQGMSQAALARKLTGTGATGFHQTTVARTESGERPLRFQEAIMFASALGISLDDLADEAQMSELEVRAGLDRAISVLIRERDRL